MLPLIHTATLDGIVQGVVVHITKKASLIFFVLNVLESDSIDSGFTLNLTSIE